MDWADAGEMMQLEVLGGFSRCPFCSKMGRNGKCVRCEAHYDDGRDAWIDRDGNAAPNGPVKSAAYITVEQLKAFAPKASEADAAEFQGFYFLVILRNGEVTEASPLSEAEVDELLKLSDNLPMKPQAMRRLKQAVASVDREPGALLSTAMTTELDSWFDKYVLARADQAAQYLWSERNIAVPHTASKKDIVATVKEALIDPDLRETLKDGFWNHFVIGMNNPQQNTEELPISVIDQVMFELEDDEATRELSRSEQSAKGLLEKELERRDMDHDDGEKKEAVFDAGSFMAAFDEACAPPIKTAHREASFAGLGVEKTAAEDLPYDLFDADDYTHAERHLGSLVGNRLSEERPRVLARTDLLIREAADMFLKVQRKFRGVVIASKSIQRIVPTEVNDSDGRMVVGEIRWNLLVADPAQRRRAALTMIMPVIAGRPCEEVLLETAAGKHVKLDKAALHRLLNVRSTVRTGKGRPRVPLAHVVE